MSENPAGSTTSANDAAEMIDDLLQEAVDCTRRQEWETEVDEWLRDYYGRDERVEVINTLTSLGVEGGRYVFNETPDPGGMIRITVNRIQNAVISMMAVQASDPPRVTFTPRESGEPPEFYLNTLKPESAQLAASFGILDPNMPIPPELATAIKQQIQAAQQMALVATSQGLPPPPVLPEDLLVEVTDRTAADALQTVVDGMWEAAEGQYVFAENVLNKNVIGWQPTLFRWEPNLKVPILTNVNAKHVFFAPDDTRAPRGHFAIYDEVLSADEATARYPQQAAIIQQEARSGAPNFPGSKYTPSAVYEQSFRRRMVVLRHCWLRYQPFPMTPDEAVGQGVLSVVDMPTGMMETVPVTDDMGNPVVDPMTGGPQMVDQPQTRQAMVDQAGAEMTPDAPNWPKRYGVRHLVKIGDEVVHDSENEFGDLIPLPTNINIPIPHSPYGQGEPKRLKGMQEAFDRVVSSLVTHQAYNAFPPEFLPQSVHDRIAAPMQNCRTKPGQRVVVPDDLLMQFQDISKILSTGEVPAMSADSWKLVEFLRDMIDSEGNLADVMQGNASAQWSGETVKSLQNAAASVIKAKSQRTEYWLRDIAKLMAHCATNFLTPEDWAKYSDKYPPAVLAAMHNRNKMIDHDISVAIASGSGASKQGETNNLVVARQSGVPISDDTLLERLGLDPDEERQKRLVNQAAQQSLAPQKPQNPTEPSGGGVASTEA